MFLKESGC
uniref:Uncharacterized protein n=1 Tax=Rhizophora mucronata TaxID=61149 RepID=A0A2P2PFI7_RHIMU